MFSVFYKSFKTPANIYSIDKYKDSLRGDKLCWLIVTMKELYTLCSSNDDEYVICELINEPNRNLGNFDI